MLKDYSIDRIVELSVIKNKIIENWKENTTVKKLSKISDKNNLCYLLNNIDKITLPPCNGVEFFYQQNKHKITSRIWEQLISKKIAGFQPLIEDEDRIYYNEYTRKEVPEAEWGFIIDVQCKSEETNTKNQNYVNSICLEALKNLKSVNGLDAEEELCYVISQEIALQIDRWIFRKLIDNAATKTVWDYATSLGDTIMEKYEALYVKIVEVSNVVNRKCAAGCANFIVTSPEVASIFETATAGFSPTMSDTFTGSLCTQYVGTINNRWRLYKDPLFQPSKMLMGYTGDSNTAQGMIVPTRTLFEIGGKAPEADEINRYPAYGNFDMKFIPNGENFYATIDIKNFII